MIKYLILSFFVCFFIEWALILLFGKLRLIGIDGTGHGSQKFHKKPTPRVGGIGIFTTFLVVSLTLLIYKGLSSFIILAATAIPIFFVGLLEDIAGHVRPVIRLSAAMLSGFIGIYLLGALITRVGFPILDHLLSLWIIAVIFTIVGVAGLANAFNIIDGFNGLLSVVAVLILLALGYVSFKLNDVFLLYVCFITIFIILGFFIWNYPFGKIFLGDGGAYFIGFIIAEISILLIVRHRQVSPWFPLLLCIYPIFETVFSIYRKVIVRRISPGLPDGLHLHMLIYKVVVKKIFGFKENENKLINNNAATSPFLWFLTSFSVIPAVIFWNNTIILIIFTFVFILIYIAIYSTIIKFKIGKKLTWNAIFHS